VDVSSPELRIGTKAFNYPSTSDKLYIASLSWALALRLTVRMRPNYTYTADL
jgi:hypothetical protein